LQVVDRVLVSRIQVNDDAGNREESGGDGNNEHLEERVHLRDALEVTEHTFDGLEGIAHILDGLIGEDLNLHAFVKQQCGSVDPLPAEDHTATTGRFEPDPLQLANEALVVNEAGNCKDSGNDGNNERVHLRYAIQDTGQSFDGLMIEDFELPAPVEQQSGKVKFLPEEDEAATTRILELDLVQPAAEALTNPFQAVINNFRRAGMSSAEVNEMLEQGRKGDIAPNPHNPLETKVHTKRMKKKRPSGIKYKKKKKPEPSEEAQEVCHSTVCCDPRCLLLRLTFRFLLSQDIVVETAKRWKDGDGKGRRKRTIGHLIPSRKGRGGRQSSRIGITEE
jgi:hypothetical protein